MKTVFAKKSRPDPELLALKSDLQEARNQLDIAYRQFNQAVDPELVDACIYQISAAKARCNYLIRSIKARTPESAPAPRRAAFPNLPMADSICAFSPAGAELCCANPGEISADEGDAVWT